MTKRILIIGASGHAQVVADILLQMEAVEPLGYVDDNPQLLGKKLLNLPVLGNLQEVRHIKCDGVVIGIGHNPTRQKIFDQIQSWQIGLWTACHPKAVISPRVTIGPGCVIAAGVVVNVACVIGANTILNTSCTVDHHSSIGAHVHIAPGVHLGGGVEIAEGALIGIGATVMPSLSVGAWSTVGAGACVTSFVPAGTTVVGMPAKPIKHS